MNKEYYKKEDIWIDEEEKEILEGIEKGNIHKVKNFEEEVKKIKTAAENYTKKKAVLNIRISKSDVYKLKRKSLELGIPYKTLISTIIHQYVNDKIKIEI